MRRLLHVKEGFTLTELLVVIAVIGILTALLIPAVSYGKFRARVVGCSNNYRQLALAAVMYADSDSLGRLPAYSLPTESSQLVKFHGLYPWLVGLAMLPAMEGHGITLSMRIDYFGFNGWTTAQGTHHLGSHFHLSLRGGL